MLVDVNQELQTELERRPLHLGPTKGKSNVFHNSTNRVMFTFLKRRFNGLDEELGHVFRKHCVTEFTEWFE